MFDAPPAREFLAGLLSIMFAITIHEFAHAYAADRAGDDTPRLSGRISLNPIDHFDPVGGMMILFTLLSGFGIGWGKPVRVNPSKFRHPKWDNIKVSMWGPLSNLLLALCIGILFRVGLMRFDDSLYSYLALRFVLMNIFLALFNLIPIAPLDGSHIFANMLSYEKARSYSIFMGQYGFICLILILVTGIAGKIIIGPGITLFRLFTGG